MKKINLEKIKPEDIILIGDLHLIKYDKERHTIYERSDEIFEFQRFAESMKAKNCVIFLGDIIDAEVPMMPSVANIIKSMKGTKILVRGNNDLLSDYEYKQMGFSHVCWAIHRGDVLFSHTSIPLDSVKDRGINKIIHGHMHRPGTEALSIYYYHRPAGNLNINAVGDCDKSSNMRCARLSDIRDEWYNVSSRYVIGKESNSAQLCQNCAIGYVFDTLPVIEEE